jgi:hypothetical protein
MSTRELERVERDGEGRNASFTNSVRISCEETSFRANLSASLCRPSASSRYQAVLIQIVRSLTSPQAPVERSHGIDLGTQRFRQGASDKLKSLSPEPRPLLIHTFRQRGDVQVNALCGSESEEGVGSRSMPSTQKTGLS